MLIAGSNKGEVIFYSNTTSLLKIDEYKCESNSNTNIGVLACCSSNDGMYTIVAFGDDFSKGIENENNSIECKISCLNYAK